MSLDLAPRQPGSVVSADRRHSAREQRQDLLEQLRSCRYLRRLARAQFDLVAARATTIHDPALVAGMLVDPVAPDLDLLQSVIGSARTGDPDLMAARELLSQFEIYEQALLDRLDGFTEQLVSELQSRPNACLEYSRRP